jgi:hypothetical protein
MIDIDIRIDPNDLARLEKAIANVRNRAEFWFEHFGGEAPRRGAEWYVNLIKVAILTQRFGPYEEYNKRYWDWKSKYMGGHTYWYLKGDLFGAVTHWLEGNSWAAGVPPNVYDSGGKSWLGKGDRGPSKPIEFYGLAVEYGTFGAGTQHKPRPLFYPAGEEIAGTKWPEVCEEALRDIESQWK